MNRKLWGILAGVIFLPVVFFAVRAGTSREPGADVPRLGQQGGAASKNPKTDADGGGRARNGTPATPAKGELVGSFLSQWDKEKDHLSGTELLESQQRILNDALNRLDGMEMAAFIDGLSARGIPSETEYYLNSAVMRVFQGDHPEDGRKWFTGMGNPVLQAKLAYNVGLTYPGKDFEGFLEGITSPKARQELLSGHCVQMVHNPVEAVRLYQELLPESGDYSGLSRVMANVHSDYAEVAGLLAPDEQTEARDVRKALMKKWAADQPVQAAEYVVANSGKVAPEQLGTVVGSWMETAPNDATKWVMALQDGPCRTQGIQALASKWKSTDPRKAWELALQVSDAKARQALLQSVHAEWAKFDPQAADLARGSAGGK